MNTDICGYRAMAYLVSGSLMTPFLHVSYNSNVTNTVGQVGGDIEDDIDIGDNLSMNSKHMIPLDMHAQSTIK